MGLEKALGRSALFFYGKDQKTLSDNMDSPAWLAGAWLGIVTGEDAKGLVPLISRSSGDVYPLVSFHLQVQTTARPETCGVRSNKYSLTDIGILLQLYR